MDIGTAIVISTCLLVLSPLIIIIGILVIQEITGRIRWGLTKLKNYDKL